MLISMVLSSAAWAQPESALRPLIESAQRWERRGRDDKAVEVWQKVLRLQPQQPDALEALGVWHARHGQRDRAQDYLRRLQQAAPQHPGVARLRYALRVGSDFDARITEARALVRAGRLAAAVARYRKAFGDRPPDRLALEYYQTLGGTPDGWAEARKGLETLVRTRPQQLEPKLALAKHLTYREPSRREGIAQLEALATKPNATAETRSAWKQALLWLQATSKDAPLFQRYLERHPNDPAVTQRLETLRRSSRQHARYDSLQAGFQALARDDVKQARQLFREGRQTAEALVGLAMVAMKQEDFDLARQLLLRVKQQAPQKPQLWQESLASASFWAKFKHAERLRASKDYAAAETELRAAIDLSPKEAHHARLALATLAGDRGRWDEAQRMLAELLQAQPDDGPTMRALIDVYVHRGQHEKAFELNRRLTTVAPKLALAEHDLEAQILRDRAARVRADGRAQEAMGLLLSALHVAPNNTWVLHDLADVYLELGDVAAARPLITRLVEANPNLPQARVLQARLLAQQQRFPEALELLDALPASKLDQAASALRDRIALQAEIHALLSTRAHRSRLAQRRTLLRLEADHRAQPELLGFVALGWAELGDADHAVGLLYEAIAARPERARGLRLQLAAVLLQSGRDNELAEVLHELQDDPTLTSRERHDLDRVRIAFAVRRVDELGRSGEYERALMQLEPLLRRHPKDEALLSALGRLFLKAGDYDEATATFERVLRDDPGHIEAREGAVSSAMAKGRRDVARRLIQSGLRVSPDHPRMHLMAARFAMGQNDDAEAMVQLKHARALAGMAGERAETAATLARRARGDLERGEAGIADLRGDTGSLLRRAMHRYGGHSAHVSLSEERRLLDEINGEIHRIEARHKVEISVHSDYRYRSGSPGLSRLNELSLPVRARIPIGYVGRISLEVTPTLVDAGRTPLTTPSLAGVFGSLGAVASTSDDRRQNDHGVGLRVGYRHRDVFEGYVGTTPLGFARQNVLGGMMLHGRWSGLSLALDATRLPVTDSVLSYAGAVDPATGGVWGGVMRQGGRLDLAWSGDGSVYYLVGGGYFLNGKHVANNTQAVGMVGGEWTLQQGGGQRVTVGASAFGMGYWRNLSRFTLGHGGYFSPQLFLRGGVPFQWRGELARMKWRLVADPGVNWFRERARRYYPMDNDLQQAWSTAVALDNAIGQTSYAERDTFGFSLNADGRFSYQVNRRFDLGVFGGVHVAKEYEEYVAGAFLQLNLYRAAPAGVQRPRSLPALAQ